MATVMVIIPGASPKLETASTVGELKTKLGLGANYQAMVEGEAAQDSTTLQDNQRVTLAEKQKGAASQH